MRKPAMSTFTRSEVSDLSFDWLEWKMMTQADDSSAVYIPGKIQIDLYSIVSVDVWLEGKRYGVFETIFGPKCTKLKF